MGEGKRLVYSKVTYWSQDPDDLPASYYAKHKEKIDLFVGVCKETQKKYILIMLLLWGAYGVQLCYTSNKSMGDLEKEYEKECEKKAKMEREKEQQQEEEKEQQQEEEKVENERKK